MRTPRAGETGGGLADTGRVGAARTSATLRAPTGQAGRQAPGREAAASDAEGQGEGDAAGAAALRDNGAPAGTLPPGSAGSAPQAGARKGGAPATATPSRG
jgi:hypothetical protein